MKKILVFIMCLCMLVPLAACGNSAVPVEPATAEEAAATEEQAAGIDYMALVNKLNPLPDGWEAALQTVTITNSVGDEVEVEKKAYEAYEKLKEDLEKNDSIYLELDSARRSVEAQQEIMDEFTEKYGADYAAKTVATPGYSEHHTGLALDLYFRLDGKDVYYNEDMVKYPEIWEKIHAKLAGYGFILRYLEDKEHITGYGYEPWHIRYIDNAELAKEITESGQTFEEYLGAVKPSEVSTDYGTSEVFTEEELKEAAVQIKCRFASWKGCELKSIRYAGDESNSEENLARLNMLGKPQEGEYTECVKFLMGFKTPAEGYEALEPNKEYTDYEWWLARTKEGGWDIVTYADACGVEKDSENKILCFGDSNTYGYDPNTGGRYPDEIIWTNLLQEKLGEGYEVINEGMNGRTTAYDLPGAENLNGLTAFEEYIGSHRTEDVIIFMLGTNDLAIEGMTAEGIAEGMEKLIMDLKELSAVACGWDPEVVIVAPALLNADLFEQIYGYRPEAQAEMSAQIAPLYKELAEKYDAHFLDASEILEVSELDGVHLTENGHRALADSLYELLTTEVFDQK